MEYKKLLNIMILFLLLILIIACQAKEKPTEKTDEEIIDTGILAAESKPSTAQVYVDDEFKGETPFTLYNIPTGQHKVVIKKDGYLDYEKIVTIQVGRTESIDVSLNPAKKTEEQKPVEEIQEKTENKSIALSKISYSSFALYYDFEKQEFTEIRTDKSDLFSRKYGNYIDFSTMPGSKMSIINKPVNEIMEKNCIFPYTPTAQLYSKQTLCVQTNEGNIFALGWNKTPDEVEWVSLK